MTEPAQTTQTQDFLGTAPIGKLLFRLSLPAIVAQLINVLYNIVDRVYLGHMADVGGLALTGVGVCAPMILVISAFAALVAMGGAPLASIELGKQNRAGAERIMGSCFALQVALSLVLTAACLIWHEPLLLWFGASENTLPYAVQYIQLYALGTIFVQLTLGMNAFISAQGFAKVSMRTTLIGALCNIILDPIFIFACGLGVRGAALATVLSQAISCVWVLAFLRSEKSGLRLTLGNIRFRKELLSCVALGVAPFIMQASESVISVCFNSSLLKYGGDVAVGAMTILSTVFQFAMLPLQGLTQGAQPISGYNFGARNGERVKKTFQLLLLCSCVYAVVLWGTIELFPQSYAALFTNDAAIVDYTKGVLRVYAGGLGLMGIQLACQMTFISMGNAKASAFLAIFRKFILLLPLIYLLPVLLPEQQALAVYLAEPIADMVAVLCTALLFRHEFQKALRAINAPLPEEGG